MRANAQIEHIRQILYSQKTLSGWRALCDILDEVDNDAALFLSDYAAPLLDGWGWPQRLRVARPAWIKEAMETGFSPRLSLASTASIEHTMTPTVRQMEALAHCPDARGLRSLELRGRGLEPAHMQAMVNGDAFEGLTHLDLGFNALGNKGAAALATAHWPLVHLDLRDNLIEDRAMEAIAQAPWTQTLTSLNFYLNRIGARGIQILATKAHLPALHTLCLADNFIGPHGAEALANAPWLSGLIALDTEGCGLGQDGVAVLRAAPGLNFKLRRNLSPH